MGGGPSRAEGQAMAEAQAEQLRLEEARRQEENRRRDEMFAEAQAQRQEARRLERERLEAEQKRADEQRNKLQARAEERRAAEQAREESVRKENEERLRKTMEESNAMADQVAQANQNAVTRATTDHQNGLNRTMAQIADAEKTTHGRVLDLAKQREEQQEQLHKEKEGYADKKHSETKEHHAKIEAVERIKFEIVAQRETLQLEHQSNMAEIQQTFQIQQTAICFARESDRREINLIDAVNNVKQAASNVSNHFTTIAGFLPLIERGISLNELSINKIKGESRRCDNYLGVVRENAVAILSHPGNNDAETANCHAAARNIPELVDTFSESIGSLREALDTGTLDMTIIKSLISDAKKNHQNFSEKVNKLPNNSRRDHTVAAITASVNAIAGASIGRISGSQNSAMVKELEA